MIKFLNNYPGKAILIIIMTLLIAISISKSVGFCSKQMLILSDVELIKITLEPYYRDEIKLTKKDISVNAYIKNHRNCCKIKSTSIMDFFDRSARYIYINYPIRGQAIESHGGA